jgi:hypothetical protein
MVVISMKPISPKTIETDTCLWAKSLFRLLKDPRPKKHLNIWRKEKSKKVKDSMKMEYGGVHRNRYNGHYMKQWIKIPKITWTSSILGRRSTCQTSSNKTFFMKDDVKDEVPNGTPQYLNSFSWGVKYGWGVKVKQHTIRGPCCTF